MAQATSLRSGRAPQWDPAVSPSADRVVGTDGPGGDIETSYLNGSHHTRVAGYRSNVQYDNPSFSPDGKRIIYSKYVFSAARGSTTRSEVWTVNVDGTDPQRLLSNALGASYSPDGKKIVFDGTVAFPGGAGLYTANADGTGRHKLSSDSLLMPEFSPNSKKIVYVAYNAAGPGIDIFIMDATGKNPTPLTNDRSLNEWPTFSPDGTKILFEPDRAVTNTDDHERQRHQRVTSWNEGRQPGRGVERR